MFRAIRRRILPDYQKYFAEFSFWHERHRQDQGHFKNAHYQKILLAMAGEADEAFLRGKIVADFGCGPRGSLVWAQTAALRIGIDVLADRYMDEFKDDLASHGMVYLKSTEKSIPLPSDFVDVMFTLNALDHVDDFPAMCREIIRVLKPGGWLIASFNLEEPETVTEPQRLNPDSIKTHLLDVLDIQSYKIGEGPKENPYAPLLENQPMSYSPGRQGHLWVRALKP